jgi:hypothetical protein
LVIDFSADVGASLSTSTMQLMNLTTGLPATLPDFVYDPALHRAMIALHPGALPNGDYRLTIPSGALPGLSTASQLDFFILAGDVNRDRSVSFADLVAVAQHYGSTSANHAQGDLNGDGLVSFADLVMVAQNYGATLPPIAPVASSIPALSLAPAASGVFAAGSAAAVASAPVIKPAAIAAKPVVSKSPASAVAPRPAPMKAGSQLKPAATRLTPIPRPMAATAFSTARIKKAKELWD